MKETADTAGVPEMFPAAGEALCPVYKLFKQTTLRRTALTCN